MALRSADWTCLFLMFSWAHWPFSPLHSGLRAGHATAKSERIDTTIDPSLTITLQWPGMKLSLVAPVSTTGVCKKPPKELALTTPTPWLHQSKAHRSPAWLRPPATRGWRQNERNERCCAYAGMANTFQYIEQFRTTSPAVYKFY